MYRLGLAENPYLNLNRRLRNGRVREIGVHPINQGREVFGEYHHLFQEIKDDEEKFFPYVRMKKRTFNIILDAIGPYIEKKTTNFRRPISPEERLVIALR